MSNPRPCACGHSPVDHSDIGLRECRRCSCCWFTDAPRKEPLRAPGHRSMSWTQAEIDSDIRDLLSASPEPSAEFRLSDGRVVTAEVQWKDDRWHVLWPPEVSGQAVMYVRVRVPA